VAGVWHHSIVTGVTAGWNAAGEATVKGIGGRRHGAPEKSRKTKALHFLLKIA
jgi:hypothetical protein